MYVHNKDDISFPLISYFNKPTAVLEDYRHDINLDFERKKIFHRLPHPYPSNCISRASNENLLGGRYTLNKCKESCAILNQLHACNATLDHWKRYITNRETPSKSTNDCYQSEQGGKVPNSDCIKKTRECLRNTLHFFNQGVASCFNECYGSPSCYEEMVDTTMTKRGDPVNTIFHLIFSAGNTITNITEIPVYPANKFITDIGGWLGLFSGMSVLSVAEIIIFIVLSVIAFIRGKPRATKPENVRE